MKAEVQSYIHQAKASDFNPVAYMNYAEYIKSVLITENSAQGKKKEKKKEKKLGKQGILEHGQTSNSTSPIQYNQRKKNKRVQFDVDIKPEKAQNYMETKLNNQQKPKKERRKKRGFLV